VSHYEQLTARIAEIGHLHEALAVLGWDQQCYMPAGAAGARANQLGTLGKLVHERFTADETGTLLAAAEAEGHAPDSDAGLTLRVVRRNYDQRVKIPARLVEELARETTLGHEVWVHARTTNNFAHFAPTLEKILDLSRQQAEALGYTTTPYDALLDQYEPGAKSAEVARVFTELRPGLIELLEFIKAAPAIDDSPLRRDFDEATQVAFGEKVIARLGFDFTRGRQDKAVHPFCTSFSRHDVRITTRVEKNWLPCALMGTIHETGHGLYEQGFAPGDDGTALSGAASLGVHESQSRLWENIVGRSRAFWAIFYPELQAAFPGTLDDVSLDTFYRSINTVQPSLIRVEADEVTYNLHVLLRFELEKALLEGALAVKDLPEAWNEKMRSYLGIVPPTDSLGCLQDVHWGSGLIGYFPTYSLGTLLSAQLFDTALARNPSIASDLEKGEYTSLLTWLRENVHYAGSRYLPHELVERVCGEPAQSRSYLRYLNEKFRALYAA
jgi:carboxypeptidase Taq